MRENRYNGSSSPSSPQTGAESGQRVCLLKSCSKSFYPRLPSQLYCEPAHGARARIKRFLARKEAELAKRVLEEHIGEVKCKHRHVGLYIKGAKNSHA